MNACRSLVRLALARVAPLAALTAGASAWAQGLPPIYDRTPVEIESASVVAEFPTGTFLEHVAIGDGGTLYVNGCLEGKVYRTGSDGQPRLWVNAERTIVGISLNPDGSAIPSGWIKGRELAVLAFTAAGGQLFVTTMWGMSISPDAGVQTGKTVRVGLTRLPARQ